MAVELAVDQADVLHVVELLALALQRRALEEVRRPAGAANQQRLPVHAVQAVLQGAAGQLGAHLAQTNLASEPGAQESPMLFIMAVVFGLIAAFVTWMSRPTSSEMGAA